MPGTTIRRPSRTTRAARPVVKAAAAALLLAMTASACGTTGSPEPSTPPRAVPKATPAAQHVVAGRALSVRTSPLTGRPTRPRILDRPVLTVKIENSVDARPQTGLAAADLVVEELVEGGITRFAAMFQSKLPRNVGPVRSVRNVDASLAGPTHGLLAYSGGAGHVLRIVGHAPVQQLAPGQAGNAYHRTSRRRAPHNLYANTRKLFAHAHRGHRTRRAYLPFAPNAARASTAAGTRAHVLRLRFSTGEHPTWTYERVRHRWMRSEGSRPARTTSGARLVASNVIVLRVRTRDAGYKDPRATSCPRPCSRAPVPRSWQPAVEWCTRPGTRKDATGSCDSLDQVAAPGGSHRAAPGSSWCRSRGR